MSNDVWDTPPTPEELGMGAPTVAPIDPGALAQETNRATAQRMKDLRPLVGKEGGSLVNRAGAGLKATEIGRTRFLESQYGKGNVQAMPSPDGKSVAEYWVYRGEGAKQDPRNWNLFDPGPGDSFWKDLPGDVADLSGDVLEGAVARGGEVAGAAIGAAGGTGVAPAVGTTAGALVGGYIGSALGGAGGVAARYGVSEMLPGKDEYTGEDLAKQASAGAALNMAGRLAGDTIGAVFKGSKERRAATAVMGEPTYGSDEALQAVEQVRSFKPSPVAVAARAAKGREVEKAVGVPLNVDELTQSRSAKALVASMRSDPKYMDRIHERDLLRIEGLVGAVNKITAATSGENVSAEEATKASAGAYTALTTTLDKARSAAVADGFAAIDGEAGGARVINAAPLMSKLDKLLARYVDDAGDMAGSSTPAKSVVTELRTIRDDLLASAEGDGGQVLLSAKRLNGLLRDWGAQAHGGEGKAFAGAEIRTAKNLSAEVFGALRDTLDAAADGGAPDNIAAGLRTVRDTFRAYSEPLDAIRSELLDHAQKLVDAGSPDIFVQKLVSHGSDVQVAKALSTLRTADPSGAVESQVRSAALQLLLERAAPAGSSPLAEAGISISPAKFAGMARTPKIARRINVLLAGDAEKKKAWGYAVSWAARVGDAGLPAGSPTHQHGVAREVMAGIGDTIQGNPGQAVARAGRAAASGVARLFGRGVSPARMIDIIEDPVKRDAWLKMAGPGGAKLSVGEVTRILAKIGAAGARQAAMEPESGPEGVRVSTPQFMLEQGQQTP